MSECFTCGACCQFATIPPFAEDELNEIDESLAEPIRQFRSHTVNPDVNFWDQLGTRVCSWFKNGKCKHYEIRPRECSTLEVGSSECDHFIQIKVSFNNGN